jgi:hypothetical protein
MSAAEMAAVNRMVDTKVVARSTPFHRTTELPTKRLPLTVRVNAGLPLVPDVGLMLDTVGTGLLIVKVSVFEVPPPGAGVIMVT